MVPEANVRVEINEKTGKLDYLKLEQLLMIQKMKIQKYLQMKHMISTQIIKWVILQKLKQMQIILVVQQQFKQNNFSDKKYAKLKKKHYIMNLLIKKMISLQVLLIVLNLNLLLSILEKLEHFQDLNQQIPGETLHEGQHVKVYVSDVDRGTKGTHIVVSRTEPQFVRRLFELEVPEVYDGTVEIKSVSREPGERSKIAVYTAVEGLDPIGSCVGPKGSRVKNVVDELHGEMIDIVEWSSDPVVYISHALSPSDVLTVSVDEEKHSALVIVPDDQLSLAIGKRGQNARLAVRLTGWKIDIKSLSEATELGLMEKIQQKEELPVDETFQDEFAQEMLDNQEEKETVVEEKENIENEVEEVTSESDVEDYEDFDDYEDDEYSKYDEDIDYDEYDKYYDEDQDEIE